MRFCDTRREDGLISATMTIPAVLSDASSVVGEFGGLITLVVGLSVGFFVVGWIISKAKGAKRG